MVGLKQKVEKKIENGNHDVACNGFSVSSVADMLIQQQLI